MKENMAIVDKKTVQELADHIDMIITNIVPNLDKTKSEIYNLTNKLYELDKIVNDKNFSVDELVNSLSVLQDEVQKNLKFLESITKLNKSYYQDVQISLNHGFSNLNQKITKTLIETVEDLPLEKLNIEVLDKIESAFKNFQSLEKDLIRLKDELEYTQKFARAILDDVESATIKSNRLNGEIDSKMNKISVFLGVIGGGVIAFLLQNYEFFLNIGANIKTTNWQGYLVIFTLISISIAGIFSVWWMVYDTVKEKEKEKYIV